MSCFIQERNVLQGENPINIYITERGKTVAKYPSAVIVRHSVFSRLRPALQLSILRRKAEKDAKISDMRQKVGDFVLEREERIKARIARQKQRDERDAKISDMRQKVGEFVLEREEREKARMARQKQRDEREQKHETPDETPFSPASVPFRELKEKKGLRK